MKRRMRRTKGRGPSAYAFALAVLAVVAVIASVAHAAASTVPVTRASDTSQAITANALKPADCAALDLTNIIVGDGNIDPGSGNSSNDLILGGPADQTIRGRGGDDCILGGGGDDSLRGDAGTDVCIGGPGTDSFNASCETQVQ